MQPVTLHAEQLLLNAAIGMLLHVLRCSAAMRGSIPRAACAPRRGAGLRASRARGPGGAGPEGSRQRGAARSAPDHPVRSIPRLPGGAGRALHGGGDRAQPGTAAPRGTTRVSPGAPLLRWGHPRWGHPPPGPTSRVFSITCVRASCPRLSGFSQVKAAPRDTSGHRRSHGADGAHTARAGRALGFPKSFLLP